MKKITAMLLTFALALSLAACSLEVEQDGINGNSQQGNSSQNSGKTETNKITFTSMTVVDNEECAIKITGIDPDNLWGYTLKVQMENKSVDKTYMFSVQSAAVNGIQSNPFFATEIAAGKKANEEISFDDGELKKLGVGDFTDIELTFRVYDSNDWTADEVTLETVHVYPYGEEKATKFVRTSQASDNVVIDNEYVTVTVTGYEKDSIWGYVVNLFLVNKTNKEVMFSVDEASVNGFMADPFFATTVISEKCAFVSLDWANSTLEDNGITEVEEIEFLLTAYDANDWFADKFAKEIITLHP